MERRIDEMPDQMEILLQEIAVLRREISHLHALLERAHDSSHTLHAVTLERFDALTALVRSIEARLPPLPQ